jgi:hypothetical protein
MDHNYTYFGAPSRGLHPRSPRLRTSLHRDARGFATDLAPPFGQVRLVPISSRLTDWVTITNFMDPYVSNPKVSDFTGREQRTVRRPQAAGYTVGLILWFRRKKFVGSYLFFKATSRS